VESHVEGGLTVWRCVLAAAVLSACASAQKAPVNQRPCYGPARLIVRNQTGVPVDVYAVGRRFIGTAYPGTAVFPLGPDEKAGFSFYANPEAGERYGIRRGVTGSGITYEVVCSNSK